MRLEKNWPFVLCIWMIFLITAVTIKLVFWNSVQAEHEFSMEELMQGIPQNDSRLLEYIHLYEAYPPPLQVANQNISTSDPRAVLSDLVTRDVLKVLKKKNSGVFVECRAFDGETLSRTLHLELNYNWTGLLMEPDPYLFPRLVAKKRNAWLLNACLSPDSTPHNLDFLRKVNKSSAKKSSRPMGSNKSIYRDNKGQVWRKLRIPCYPLFSITSALQISTIDFLILDTQGLELQILLNVPWNEIDIRVITVNIQFIPEGAEGIKYFMSSKRFNLLSTTGYFYTFVHESTSPSLSGLVSYDSTGEESKN